MLTNFSSSVCSSALDDEIYDVSTVTVGNTCWPAEPNDPKTKRVIGGLLPCCGRVMRRNRVWETCSDLFSKCFPSLFAGENRAEQVWRGCLISRVFKLEKRLCPWHKFRSEVWPLVWSKPYSKSLWNAASDVFFSTAMIHSSSWGSTQQDIFNPSRWFWLCPQGLFPLVLTRVFLGRHPKSNPVQMLEPPHLAPLNLRKPLSTTKLLDL